MPGTAGVFPNADPSGQYIPFDLLFPTNSGIVDFTTSVSASVSLPTNASMLIFRSTENCFIRFGAVAEVPASGSFVTNQAYVASGEIVQVVPSAATFTVIGESAAGRLNIQVAQPWTALAIPAANRR